MLVNDVIMHKPSWMMENKRNFNKTTKQLFQWQSVSFIFRRIFSLFSHVRQKSMFSTTVSFQTVVLATLIPVQLLAVILQIIGLIECKQCLLFARIYEIERILEGGFTGWCYMLIAHGLLLIFGCIVMLSRRPMLGIAYNSLSKSEKSWTLLCVSISTAITTCFVIIGWQQFCNSFKVVRCYHTPSLLIDWKSYTPKYSSCYNTYYYYTITEVCFFCSSVLLLFLLLKTVWSFKSRT